MTLRRAILIPTVAATLAGCVAGYGLRRAISSFMDGLPALDDPLTDFYDYLEQRFQEAHP